MRISVVLLALVLISVSARAQQPENVFVIIIDGLRHEEGWAREATYLPHIWDDLRPQGTVLTNFWDRGWTATTGGHNTILSGARQILRNNGGSQQDIRSFDPLMFEYYRRHFGTAESLCGVVVGKWGNVGSICDHSIEPAYGETWQGFQLGDELTHDDTVSSRLLHEAMDSTYPRLVLLNLADVDSRGHNGIYDDYLAAIVRADSVIHELWKHIQGIPPYTNMHYRDKTVMIVTSDHGRNDDCHGSFFGHGEWDHGSRQLGLLAVGPGIAAGRRIDGSQRDQIDIVPTIGAMLGFATPFSEGAVMTELFASGFAPPPQPLSPAEPVPLAANLSANAGFSRDPDIAQDRDGNLYLVWSDSTPGKWSVLCRKSTDDGATWSTFRVLFDFPESESLMWYARVAADDSVAVAAMGFGKHLNRVDSLDPSRFDTTFIWYPWLATSNDAGNTWAYASLLDSSMGSYHAPVAVRDGRVAVAWWACGQFTWQSPRNGIFFNNREPSSAWRPGPVEVTGQQSVHIDLVDDGVNYHLVGNGFRGDDFDLVYCRSTDNGANWTKTWVADDPDGAPIYDYDPALAVDDSGIVHLFWARKENVGGAWRVMYGRRDTLTGVFDTTSVVVGPEDAWQPHAAVKADTVALVWLDYRDGNPEVYYRFSTDRGLAWSEPERVTYTTALTQHPRIAAAGDGFYCVWQDLAPGNWEVYGRKLGTSFGRDAGLVRIDAPTGSRDTMASVVPRATHRNNGPLPATFTVFFTLTELGGGTTVHRDSQPVVDLDPGVEATVSFREWARPHPVGSYAVRCSLYYAGDNVPANDVGVGTFSVFLPLAGWQEKAPVPAYPNDRQMKDGAWLCRHGDSIFAAKGYKTGDFYCYLPQDDTWLVRETIPGDEDGRYRPPRKGCRGTSNGAGAIYMTKGNNSLGFWRYDVFADNWTALAGVPAGPSNKKVKGGTDMAYVVRDDTGYVYLLKGYLNEFYRYNTRSGRWDTMAGARYGYKNRYYEGSFLAFDGANAIYAHQSRFYDRDVDSSYHYMWRYDIDGDSWNSGPLTGMPLYGLHKGKLARKRSRDGGSGDWYSGGIYALKGGNTQQFFRYFPDGDTWRELDTIPYQGASGRPRRVKSGGDFVTLGDGFFYAFKGNKTYDLWRYVVAGGPAPGASGQPRSGAQADKHAVGSLQFAVSPNPIATGFVTVRLVLPEAGPVSLTMFDVAGRSVLRQSGIGSRQSTTTIDLRRLSSGVYLVRLEANGCTAVQKLVVRR